MALSPKVARTTLTDPPRKMSRWFCDSGRTTKPQQSAHVLPLDSPPGPHCGVTRKVGPPLGALVVHVDIGDCEIGVRLDGRPVELAGDNRALERTKEPGSAYT